MGGLCAGGAARVGLYILGCRTHSLPRTCMDPQSNHGNPGAIRHPLAAPPTNRRTRRSSGRTTGSRYARSGRSPRRSAITSSWLSRHSPRSCASRCVTYVQTSLTLAPPLKAPFTRKIYISIHSSTTFEALALVGAPRGWYLGQQWAPTMGDRSALDSFPPGMGAVRRARRSAADPLACLTARHLCAHLVSHLSAHLCTHLQSHPASPADGHRCKRPPPRMAIY